MLNKTFSLRELIFIGLLIVAAVYYFAFHVPISNRMSEIETEQVQVDAELEVAQNQVATLGRMEKALKELEASGTVPSPLPEYNNIDDVLLELNTIMAGTTYYDINFSDASADSENIIARRTIDIRFSVANYQQAAAKIKEIAASSNRYLISGLSMNSGYTNEIVMGRNDAFTSVSVTLTCFEFINPKGEQVKVKTEE